VETPGVASDGETLAVRVWRETLGTGREEKSRECTLAGSSALVRAALGAGSCADGSREVPHHSVTKTPQHRGRGAWHRRDVVLLSRI
jgi:hypothetical protein